jgi:cbb3-type cytochrome oxidase cytochrome c subunit
MAATDQTYRQQKTLDLVFAVSCVLMLASIVGMFAQDFYRPFKVEQRIFRDVEEAVAQRQALDSLPEAGALQQAEQEVQAARAQLDQEDVKTELADLTRRIGQLVPKKVDAEARYQAVKATFDSQQSLYNIEVEKQNAAADEAARRSFDARIGRMRNNLTNVEDPSTLAHQKMRALQEFEDVNKQLEDAERRKKELEKPLTEALDRLKKLNTEFDRFRKNAELKQWKWGDTVRAWPILDAFASPTRIQQFTLEELPIDYYFRRVPRFDRCTTCHLGIDRSAYTKLRLASLGEVAPEQRDKLDTARQVLEGRRDVVRGIPGLQEEVRGLNPRSLDLATVPLTTARITEFCAHPRLDLFVGDKSPHPAEKFGCTACHAGQGSATDFYNASHTPNTLAAQKEWRKAYGWAANHYWDFPMLPQRFVESSCVKCHHQITALANEAAKIDYHHEAGPDGSVVIKEVPAPGAKLVKGYNLVRENGCFGCHEIAGLKAGVPVGPDLRLEPSPALDQLSAAERAKALADPLNPPGTMRKVGPSLRRLAEKTNEEWVRKWLRAPRDFRPDTRMPHFYGLSNNSPEALAGTGQEKFPAAEMHAITHYLFRKSREYVDTVKDLRKEGADQARAEEDRIAALNAKAAQTPPTPAEKKELDELTSRARLRQVPRPIADPVLPAGYQEDKARGRQLFTERGCLACHMHQGTSQPGEGLPAVTNEVHFGPNLSRLAAKLGTSPGDKASARRWLIQWIKNPTVYHPRTFMPVTHLTDAEAADLAAWLLDQPADWQADDVPEPDLETLKALASVYLVKAGTQRDVRRLLDPEDDEDRTIARSWLAGRPDSDEAILAGGVDADRLKLYIGKKGINQLGCFGCHDIPGFESAKPIGTPLNEWGKKDPERLAFEDITAYVKKHYHVADHNGGHAHADETQKPHYDSFFFEALEHHRREGFLYQKLNEPRSYDHDRIRTWDERLRMPQFQFAHGKVTPKPGESPEQAEHRAEAEAREAVMTLILGLVGEPMPAKYVHTPPPDRAAEVRGIQVLEKYNCIGCHQVRPGLYEFKATDAVKGKLEDWYSRAEGSSYAADHVFPQHNAWVGKPPAAAESLTAHALQSPVDEGLIRLTQALRFTNKNNEVRQIRAGEYIDKPARDELVSHRPPYGGTFTELLVSYLVERKVPNLDDNPKARSGLPPPLARQGEKAQPEWLFRFLLNPHPIRTVAILRMPQFNMSEDEAMALVNYFAAVDKMENAGIGLTYPYLTIPQRDEEFWRARTAEYVARLTPAQLEQRLAALRPLWQQLMQERLAELERRLPEAEKAAKEAKDEDAKKRAAKDLADMQQEIQALKAEAGQKDKPGPFQEARKQEWLRSTAYATDAYRLLAAPTTPCMSCHEVANRSRPGVGPPLELTPDRLRPDWLERWLANPQRMMVYPVGNHPMPINLPRGDVQLYPEFAGSTREQAAALRDLLMSFPKVADLPENRRYQPPATGGAK